MAYVQPEMLLPPRPTASFTDSTSVMLYGEGMRGEAGEWSTCLAVNLNRAVRGLAGCHNPNPSVSARPA